MLELEVVLDQGLDGSDVGEAAYWLNFVSPEIIKYVIEPSERRHIHLWLPNGADTSQVERKTRDTLAAFGTSRSVVTDSDGKSDAPRIRVGGPERGPGDLVRFVPEDAIDAGVINVLGVADVAIGSPMVELIRGLDGVFRGIGSRFGAVERSYSTLLPIDYLQKCRYFDAFPQNIMFSAHLEADVDAARQFVERTLANGGRPPRDFDGFAEHTHVLAPAACFHVYQGMQDVQLLQNTAVTTLGRCFRYESRNARLVERLWDFSMRELVFIGEPDYVRDCREQSRRMVLELVEQWELTGVIEIGHDPFFLRGERDDVAIDPHPKFELRLDLPYRQADFACASFNVCGTFFSSVSGILTPSSEVAWSGCTAFGLERWAWAVVAQHGIDPDVWPEALSSLLRAS